MIYVTIIPLSLIQSPLRTVERPSLISFFFRALVCFFHACCSRLIAIKSKKIHEIGGTWTASCPFLLLLGTLYLGHILQYQWLAKSYRGSTISDPMPGHGLILDSHTYWKNTQGTVTYHWVCEIQSSTRLGRTNSGLQLLGVTKL